MSPNVLLSRDLDAAVAAVGDGWRRLDGGRLFVTGGTGFIGRWLLETFVRAQQMLGVRFEVDLLTRDPAAFKARAGALAAFGRFHFIAGDVVDFAPMAGGYTHIIHAAADASARLNAENPRRMFDVIVDGTRKILDLASLNPGARVLNLSSGAVYGRQPAEMERIDESWLGAPDCRAPVNAYAEGKRAAEMLCAIHTRQFGVEVMTARIFAVVGPFLPLDTHFAIGNFILDAMNNRPIVVASDGRAVRSYLYAGDLTAWLLRLLIEGKRGACYNVGSPRDVSIAELAQRVANSIGAGAYEIKGSPDAGWNPGRYVPSTAAIEADLGVRESVTLEEALIRTAQWHGWKRKNG